MNVFDHIRVEAANFPVQRMCALLGVSRSDYYGYLARRGQPPPSEHGRLVAKIRSPSRSSRA